MDGAMKGFTEAQIQGWTVHLQQQSRLFSLPPELLRPILEYAVGGNTFHIFCEDETAPAKSWPCENGDACFELRSRSSFFVSHPADPKKEKRRGAHPGLLSMSRSYRSGYLEATPLLYSHNRFVATDKHFVESLPRIMPPKFLPLIRHFSCAARVLAWPLPTFLKGEQAVANPRWIALWRGIALLTGLKTLRVFADFGNVLTNPNLPFAIYLTSQWRLHQDLMLTPVREITAPSQFDLFLQAMEPQSVEGMSCRVHGISPAHKYWKENPEECNRPDLNMPHYHDCRFELDKHSPYRSLPKNRGQWRH